MPERSRAHGSSPLTGCVVIEYLRSLALQEAPGPHQAAPKLPRGQDTSVFEFPGRWSPSSTSLPNHLRFCVGFLRWVNLTFEPRSLARLRKKRNWTQRNGNQQFGWQLNHWSFPFFRLIDPDSNCLSVIVVNTISAFLSDYSEPGIIKYFENIEKNPEMKRNIPSIPPNSVWEVHVPRRKNPITRFSILHVQSDPMVP